MMMMIAIKTLNQIEQIGNPTSQLGFENDKRYNQRLVSFCKISSKKVDGICAIIQIVVIHDIHKKIISSGVKIKFAKGLIIEIGIPHKVKRGRERSEIKNCISKNEMM